MENELWKIYKRIIFNRKIRIVCAEEEGTVFIFTHTTERLTEFCSYIQIMMTQSFTKYIYQELYQQVP